MSYKEMVTVVFAVGPLKNFHIGVLDVILGIFVLTWNYSYNPTTSLNAQ